MWHAVSRIGWLAAVVLAVCVLGGGTARADDDDAEQLDAAFAKGKALREKGQLQEALPYLEKAVELALRVYGKDDTQTAVVISQLADVCYRLGRYQQAEPLYRRCLQILIDRFGTEDPYVAHALDNLAQLYQAMGHYDKAEPLFKRGLEIFEDKRDKNDPDVAITLNNLALLYKIMGRYDKAESLFKRCRQIQEDNLGKDHPGVAASLNNLADLYRAMGRYEEAEALFRASLKIREDKLGKDHLDVAQSLNNLAGLYLATGRYEQAEPLYKRSLQILEDKLGKDHPDVANSLNNLAGLYRAMGRYEQAEPLYRRSLQIREDKLGKDHPLVGSTLSNLANLYQDTGRYEQAEPLYKRSIQILEDKLGKNHPAVGTSLNGLACLCQNMGRYEEAEPLFKRSLQILEDNFGKDHPNVPTSLNNLAELHAALGRWKEAADATDQARRIARRRAARLLPTLPEKEQLDFLNNTDVGDFRRGLSLALARSGDEGMAALSAGWVLNGKAVAHEALARLALLALDAGDPATAELSRHLLGVRRQLAGLSLAAVRPGQEDQRRKLLDELAEQEDDLSRRLGQASGRSAWVEPWVELADVRKALPADAALIEISRYRVFDFQAKDRTKPWGGYRYAAWVIAAEGDVQMVDLGPAEAIEDAVKAVRQAVKDAQGSPKQPSTITQEGEPDAEKEIQKPLRALSKLVLDPLAEHIDGKKRWYVSPDASLWLVPWAALPLKDGRYAVEAHTISYLISGRELVAPPSRAKPGRPRMMADPDYDLGLPEARAATAKLVTQPDGSALSLRGLPTGLTLGKAPRLPGTAAEAKATKPALEKYAGEEATLFQDKDALEGVFKSFRGPRVLVLSTHGFFLPDQEAATTEKAGMQDKAPALDKEGKPLQNPLLRCGLLLAGCNNRDQAKEGDEDGVLTGLEVVGTDLRGTDLVVLSACETGLGDVHNGEGVAGLRQAFQLAGARSVAATLWQVPDRESAKLMADFFGNLAAGKAKAEALRDAQLAMMKQHRDGYAAAHPFFWAAFTLTGE